MLTVTERFTRWLHLSRFSQADVARQLGRNRSVITQWKTGVKRPTLDDAVRLEAITGIPASAWATTRRLLSGSRVKTNGRKAKVA